MSEQEKCGGQRPVFGGSSGAIYLILEQGLSLSLEITDEVSLAASEPQGPTCPWFPYAEIMSGHQKTMIFFLNLDCGDQLSSLCMQRKHFKN